MRGQKKTTRSSKKIVKRWMTLFVCLTLVQLLVLFGIDQFLKAPALEALASVKSGQESTVTRPEVPAEAVQTEYSGDNKYAAYTTADNELVVLKGNEESFRKKVGEVKYMKWLGESNALVYFVEGKNLTGYLLHADGDKPAKISTWSASNREVEKTFFSPYMEFLYIQFHNGERTEVYKFDAAYGISQIPLGNLKVDDIQYDDKKDIMTFTTPEGEVWRYEEDRLYRPDGSEVKQAKPVHHRKPSEQEYSNKK
ncbi:hypothetical protein ACQCN2_19515 [Brevibacillus ginsengisoli]|uniref:hypothetical protein n=1 Tax=Brevibacillus ginsengisoli TaxID=363854 RepID=UPI003CE97139